VLVVGVIHDITTGLFVTMVLMLVVFHDTTGLHVAMMLVLVVLYDATGFLVTMVLMVCRWIYSKGVDHKVLFVTYGDCVHSRLHPV
jgi:hypothetical protein